MSDPRIRTHKKKLQIELVERKKKNLEVLSDFTFKWRDFILNENLKLKLAFTFTQNEIVSR